MKRIFIIVALIIIAVTININNKKEEIRVRIIPNSDEKEDILLKEKVKSAVIYYLDRIYVEDYDEYVNNINQSLINLENIIDDNYIDCNIDFSYHTLYNKEYHNIALKNEKVLTLVITLGSGKGSNWWGTIYPEYLKVEGESVVEYESLFVNLINYIKGDTKK